MGIDPASLTDRQRKLMDPDDRQRLGRAGMTAEDGAAKYALDQERQMHSLFSGYCHSHGILFEHENPAKRSTSRPGWPDFRCFYPVRHFLAVEFKARPNVLMPEQEEVKAALEACGFRYIVAYSLVEAIHAAQQYLLKGDPE
jgi:hypothetical protein